jgi:hypothetical protein
VTVTVSKITEYFIGLEIFTVIDLNVAMAWNEM